MSKNTTRRRNTNNSQVLETKIQEPKEEDVLVEQFDFEIQCPRCGDVMELFGESDHLSYYSAVAD